MPDLLPDALSHDSCSMFAEIHANDTKGQVMSAAIENRFLSTLSSPARDLLLSLGTAVSLPLKTPLYTADQLAPFAFLLTSGVASLVTSMQDGGVAEVGMIGNEGLVGSLHLLGPGLPVTDCMMQLAGTAIRIPLPELRNVVRSSEEIRTHVLEFVQQQNLMLGQIAGCNRLHSAEERLSRWLLMAFDRTPGQTLNFTQEFLADMVGARRTTVTLVAGTLQRSGLIEYQRGHVRIVDRERLEAAACSCYGILKRLHSDLYRNPSAASPPPSGSTERRSR